MTDAEVDGVIDYIGENPSAGDEIAGSGGCRKVRIAGKGEGKSGGYRVITFYTGVDIPVYLLTVFSKGEKANLSKAECNALRIVTKAISDYHKAMRFDSAKKGTR